MTQGDDMCPVCYDRTDAELRTVSGVIYSKESNCPECSRAALRAEVARLTAERDALRQQIEAGAALLRDCRERILIDADAFAKAGRISRAIKCDLLIDRIDAAINSTPRDETAG